MFSMIASPSKAIELLGGSAVVAGCLRKPPTTVASWGARQSIPVEFWPPLIGLAGKKGVAEITYESLVDAHAKAARALPKRKAKKAA